MEYMKNTAQLLVKLHDSRAVFDFCGGMMFQLVLTDKLRTYLSGIATAAAAGDASSQIVVADKSVDRMAYIPGYRKSADADERIYFHGREVRKVPNAEGGMGFVLQLSHSKSDPEGWTTHEVEGYDGWGHDTKRKWRTGKILQEEGCKDFISKFGPVAFTLNHRFYFHEDSSKRLWLSAEDGCEGYAVLPPSI